MSAETNDAQRWLDLAVEARGIAVTMNDGYDKRTLLLIAQRYEMLAERAKRRGEQGEARKSA